MYLKYEIKNDLYIIDIIKLLENNDSNFSIKSYISFIKILRKNERFISNVKRKNNIIKDDKNVKYFILLLVYLFLFYYLKNIPFLY